MKKQKNFGVDHTGGLPYEHIRSCGRDSSQFYIRMCDRNGNYGFVRGIRAAECD